MRQTYSLTSGFLLHISTNSFCVTVLTKRLHLYAA